MPLLVYLGLILFEFVYMICIPAQRIFAEEPVLTSYLFEVMTGPGVYMFLICMTVILLFMTILIIFRGKSLK